jgi:hypothetical protein
MLQIWLGWLLLAAGTGCAYSQVLGEEVTLNLAKSQKGMKLTGVKRERCGLSAAGAGTVESGAVAAPFPFSSLSAGWVSDIPQDALTVRLRVSRDKKEWSEWTTVSGPDAVRSNDGSRLVGKPVAAGRSGYVQFGIAWKAPGCVKEIAFSFMGLSDVPPAKAQTK